MRHPVLECIPARAANHPPKQPATQEPAESQAASRAPSSAPGEAQHQQPQQEEQTTSTLNSPPFTRASARRPRGKQPRPQTSVAGTTMQDSGHDRAQRFLQAKNAKPKPVKGAPGGESSLGAAAAPGD